MRLILSACLLASLVACSTKEPDTYVEAPVEQLYNDATDAMTDGRFGQAAKLFDEVERQHPYSIWATKAQLMAAFAQYSQGKYDEAIGTSDRFIQLHPGNRDVAYAYYMRALSYYEQITDVRRDQRITADAMKSLDEVIRRFPESNYARDARIKMDLTRDHLAGKEMDIGRYYQKQGQFTAAIGRFRRVVDEYQTTSHVPEALHRLTEAYLAVGVRDEAEKVAAVLGHNYPGSEWYADSYALLTGGERPGRENQGFLGRTVGKLF
jgi:outer membrane protein assembly factor BamD